MGYVNWESRATAPEAPGAGPENSVGYKSLNNNAVARIPKLLQAWALCLAVLIAHFLALEALALRFSDDARIIENLQMALAQHVLPTSNDVISPYGDANHRFDMFMECTSLSANLGNEEKPLLYRLAATPVLWRPREQPCDVLRAALRSGLIIAERPYFRYWHGYQIYLRPLLSLITLQEVHRINALLLIGALAALIYWLVSFFGLLAAPAFIIPFVVGSDLLTVPAVSVHSLSLIWIFASAAIFACMMARKRGTDTKALTVVFGLGAIANFFDLLFNPPLAPTLLAFLVLWRRMSHKSEPPAVTDAITSAAGVVTVWFAGFALAWITKWLFAGTVLGFDRVVPDVWSQILFRLNGPVPGIAAEKIGLFSPTYSALDGAGFSLILTCIGLAAIFLSAHSIAGRLAKIDLVHFAVLLLPLLIPVVWVEVLRNHTMIHVGFVARTFVLFAVLPLLAALAVCHRPLSRRLC
jgi:hypothetical protein